MPLERFKVRSEDDDDVGIDLIVELKHNGFHTNFRFAVQLKATASIRPLADGSYTFPVELTNVNYLFNFSGPAFYVLYVKEEDSFYYKNAHSVFMDVAERYPQSIRPERVGVNFSDKLDRPAIIKLHDQIYNRSQNIRKINHLLNVNLQRDELADRITIVEREQVFGEREAVESLEKQGLRLMNAYDYDEILRLKGLTDHQQVKSGLFHAVCGLAHYRKAEMLLAIVSFKLAIKFKDSLAQEMLDMVNYHQEAAKYMLGINTRAEYDATVERIVHSTYIKLFLSIEQRYHQLFDEEGLTEKKVAGFYQSMQEICEHPEADENVILHARAQILEMESEVLNHLLVKNITANKNFPWAKDVLQVKFGEWQTTADLFGPRAESLRDQALAGKHYFAYNIITITMVKASYRNLFIQLYMINFDPDSSTINIRLTEEMMSAILANCEVLDGVIKNYAALDSNENVVVALSLKYELLHLIGYHEQAQEIAARMEELIGTYDLKDLGRRYRFMMDSGTKHELFLRSLIDANDLRKKAQAERDEIWKEIDELNAKEKAASTGPRPGPTIDVTPLGMFRYQKEQFDELMDILDVVPEVREQVRNVAEYGAVPIINVLERPVLREGPVPTTTFSTMEQCRDLLMVRKALYESKIIRLSK